jgi:hypothetical protein
MQTLESISAVDLFPLERAALLDLLESLDPPAWERETVCAGWVVRDIAARLVGDDLGLISRVRDAYRLARRGGGAIVDRPSHPPARPGDVCTRDPVDLSGR